jgi:hypothetical protein
MVYLTAKDKPETNNSDIMNTLHKVNNTKYFLSARLDYHKMPVSFPKLHG